MDRRTRELERAYKESGDLEYHAELLRALMRIGLLGEKQILCAGFFGHKTCRIILPEYIKKTKVIVGSKVLKNEEMFDFIRNIFYWDDIYHYANIAAIKLLCSSRIYTNPESETGSIIAARYNEYLSDKNSETFKKLCSSFKRLDSPYGLTSWQSRQMQIHNALSYISTSISRKNLKNNMLGIRMASVLFKDKILRESIYNEVIPHLLGEWR